MYLGLYLKGSVPGSVAVDVSDEGGNFLDRGRHRRRHPEDPAWEKKPTGRKNKV